MRLQNLVDTWRNLTRFDLRNNPHFSLYLKYFTNRIMLKTPTITNVKYARIATIASEAEKIRFFINFKSAIPIITINIDNINNAVRMRLKPNNSEPMPTRSKDSESLIRFPSGGIRFLLLIDSDRFAGNTNRANPVPNRTKIIPMIVEIISIDITHPL